MNKNRIQSYMKIYDKLFASIKDKKISLLEIVKGNGEDIKLWYNYFKNAEIYGIYSQDAYNEEILNMRFNNKKFNIIIENGSYDLNSLIKFIKIYSNHLTNDGILLIQDIQSIKYLQILKDATPLNLHNFIETYDLREINNIYDDILYIINKNQLRQILPSKSMNVFENIYEIIFRKRKMNELILLNIGLNEENMKYMINYFEKSILFGIGMKNDIEEEIKSNNRVKLYLETSPYDINLESSNIKFDIIISHYETDINKIVFLINTYSKILNYNGILIMEDIDENNISKIKEMINPELKDIMETYKENNKNIIIINK